MVSDEEEFSMGHMWIFFPSKVGLTKEVVFHEGGLSKEILLHFGAFCGITSEISNCGLAC